MKDPRRKISSMLVSLALLFTMVTPIFAQQTLGNVRGIVKDESGAAIVGAKVTMLEKSTNKTQTATTSDSGEYEFKNTPVGEYKITIEASNFKALVLDDVRVQLNQTTDVPATLAAGLTTETVNVSAGGAELIDTTTTNLAKGFESRQVVDLAQTSSGAGIYNLALVAPNVVSTGGVGVGTGGSVGGQRARNNNFVVDGVDNNDKAVTGPQVYVSPEAVQEFSLLSNQYSAEFARSTGGQFITTTKSGTNEFHGTAYGFFQNRHLNALDTQQKAAGITRDTSPSNPNPNPRFDYGRFGGNVGGPIIKNKLFFFGMFERFQQGAAAGAGTVETPTAAGFAALDRIPGLSATNLGVFKQYVPVAEAQTGNDDIIVSGVSIPIGVVSIPSPNFFYNNNFIVNLDYNMSEKTQMRGRYIFNQTRTIDPAATLPVFFQLIPTDTRLFSYTLLHSITSNLSSETRLAYRRYVQTIPAGNFSFPGLDQFPNIGLLDLGSGGVNIGPDGNAPQSGIENNYQLVENVGWLHGSHSFKFGGDARKIISPQSFVQRARGDYEYTKTDLFLHDISGDFLSERTIGVSPYEGNQKLIFLYGQDDWRIRPNLTLNLGLNYAYQEVPFSARQQTLNSIADAPGLITFSEPKSQKKNFAPRVGFAYSPDYRTGILHTLFGDQGKSSIRAGFSMAYDVIFDNLYILSLPPQFNQTIDVDPGVPNFLANGGILPVLQSVTTSVADARAATSAWIPDQQVPYSLTYTLSVQREFGQNWGMELRYLGTRGVHLLTQNRINRQAEVTDTRFIPTFFTTPSRSDLAGLPTAATLFAGQSSFVPAYAAAGFNAQSLVAFLSNGNSTYNGFSAQLTHRLANGLQGSAAYTLSHLIDDTTAEVFSTVLSPRRVEDFQNLKRERADSALDHRHRFVTSLVYDLPFFNHGNALVRSLAGGWSVAGTYSAESGEKFAVQSGIDANINGDAAGDRTIINLNGVRDTATAIHGVNSSGQTVCGTGTTKPCNSAGNIATVVAYVADNPNAQYVQAGRGAKTNAGRNTVSLPIINNLDFSVFKNFRITEGTKIQFRVDMFNAFNHPQFVPGSVNGVQPVGQTGVLGLVTAGSDQFNRPDLAFTSHPRVIQLALRFNF
jgi:Carboxypeptidase regulatory-like domain